jgi:putative ABC transport system permease protein
LNDNDTAGAPPVALINETFATREFVGNPIGQRILVREIVAGTTEFGREIAWEIVGVIANEKITGLGDEAIAGMYVSNEQSPTYGLSLIVQTGVPPESLQKGIRTAIDRVNRNQALSDVRTLEQIVARSMLGNRVVNTLLVAFAAMALLLAAVGIYGVIAYTAAQRTYEMGIRAALGASPGNLRSLVLREGMLLTAIGLAIGLAGTFAATRLLSWMLYGVGAFDPLTLAVVAVALSGVAGLACYVPARRITSIDPMRVLRS